LRRLARTVLVLDSRRLLIVELPTLADEFEQQLELLAGC
jgi:hypothetical protein